jgi:hypothetical protein
MAHSTQAKLKSPQAVLQLGVSNEDSKVREMASHGKDEFHTLAIKWV